MLVHVGALEIVLLIIVGLLMVAMIVLAVRGWNHRDEP
jgi:hypothetical protein